MPTVGSLTYGQLDVWRDVQDHQRDRWHEANLSAVWPLPERVELGAVEAALRGLAERHGSLRTTYDLGDPANPLQVLAETASSPDVRVLADREETADDLAGELAGELAREPFDLSAKPAWLARIVLRGGQPATVVLAHHHMVADAWSQDVLKQDFYASLVAPDVAAVAPGIEPSLIELADEQRGSLGEMRNQQSMRTWERFYAEVTSTEYLERVAKGRQDELDAEVLQAGISAASSRIGSVRIAGDLGISPSSVLLAAYAKVVARHYGISSVPVWLMSSNRFQPRFRNLVTSLNQWCPLLVEAPGDQDFEVFAKQVHVQSLNTCRRGVFDPDEPTEMRRRALAESAYDGTVWAFNYIDIPGLGHESADGDREISWESPFHTIGPRHYLRAFDGGTGSLGFRYRTRASSREEVSGVLLGIIELLNGRFTR